MGKDKLQNFIEGLDTINKDNTITIKVPSHKKKLTFKLINVTQHKNLLKSAFQGYEGVIKASMIFNNILTDNHCDDDLDFAILDRTVILTELRKKSIGSNIKIEGTTYDIDSLSPITDKFTDNNITENGVSVIVDVPTISRDSAIAKKLLAEFSKLDDKDKDADGIDLVLTYEIIKFIKSVSVGDEVYEFTSSNAYDCKKIIESLPLKLNNKIVDYISEYREYENKHLTFEDGTLLEIDAGFLSSE